MKLIDYIAKHFNGNKSAFAQHNDLAQQQVGKMVEADSRLITETDDGLRLKIEFKSHLAGIPIKAHDWVDGFDIEKHKFADSIAGIAASVENDVVVTKFCNGSADWAMFEKGDIIAMAKALGVTGKDLK